MSRTRNLDIDDRDPIELADDARYDRPDIDVEPADFDDVRIAERYGVQAGGHFAFENPNRHDLDEEPF
jgi:hypothetical protein